MLPVRIELTTSALPRMRSTTELRQHSQLSAGVPEGVPRRCRGPMDKATARVKAACPMLSYKIIGHLMKQRTPRAEEHRAARLAEALRANLHRRKAQARAAAEARGNNEESDQ